MPDLDSKRFAHVRGRWTRLALALVMAFLMGYLLAGRTATSPVVTPQEASETADHEAHGPKKATIWTCSMHPQIRQPKPGRCPICGMDLVPVADTAGGATALPQLATTEASKSLMRIETTPVERRFVTAEVRMVGKVEPDETRLGYITAWAPGRIDRMFVDYTGIEVRQGDHMVSLYSPELLSAQEELRRAAESVASLRSGAPEVLRHTAESTLEAARSKLRRWGLTDAQVQAAERSGTVSDHITIYAPVGGTVIERNGREGMYVEVGTMVYAIADLSTVWLKLQAYESDLTWIRYGQTVTFTVEACPGRMFEGRIAFIDPMLDEMTRTVMVRVNVPNPDGLLKPGMFVRAVVKPNVAAGGRVMDPDLAGKWICPMHPEVVKEGPGTCDVCGMALVRAEKLGYASAVADDSATPLVIPVSAALVTGKRAVVYVELPDTERPTFEGREVVLGPRAGDHYIVESGLQEGEEVVTQGNFKIDSALQILAKPSMMNPAEPIEPKPDAEPVYRPVGDQPADARAVIPDAFQKQLRAVLDRYFALQAALAADNLAEARASVAPIREALATADMTLLKGETHMAWMKDLETVNAALKQLDDAKDLAATRTAFAALSQSLIASAKRFGIGSAQPVYRLHCPMAFDGKGADWLQATQEVQNPYFGARMPQCGSVEETLHGGGTAP